MLGQHQLLMDNLILPPKEALLKRIVKMFEDRSGGSLFPYNKLRMEEYELNGQTRRFLDYEQNNKAICLEPISEGYEISYLVKSENNWKRVVRRKTNIEKADFSVQNIIDKSIQVIDELYGKYF